MNVLQSFLTQAALSVLKLCARLWLDSVRGSENCNLDLPWHSIRILRWAMIAANTGLMDMAANRDTHELSSYHNILTISSITAPVDRNGFEIAIVCVTRAEADTTEAMLDKVWVQKYRRAPGDTNAYTAGAIGSHNVISAYMLGMRKATAAGVAACLRSSLPGIRLVLVVGVYGGAPKGPNGEEALLGDVIISTGIVQYDFGRRGLTKFDRKDALNDNLGRPNSEIRSYLAKLAARRGREKLRRTMLTHLEILPNEPDFSRSRYPGITSDFFFEGTYEYKHHQASVCAVCDDGKNPSCSVPHCDETSLIQRVRLLKASEAQQLPQPTTHHGKIASGDTVMRSGKDRDEILRATGVIGFEMEGAGMWDSIPFVVIKGACGYADSHKNKDWHEYAAAATDSCIKAFLEEREGSNDIGA